MANEISYDVAMERIRRFVDDPTMQKEMEDSLRDRGLHHPVIIRLCSGTDDDFMMDLCTRLMGAFASGAKNDTEIAR